MDKRLRLTIVAEYRANPIDYDTDDPVEMAKIDQSNLEDGSMHIDEFLSDCDSSIYRIEPITD